jgi:hypothetical protein
MGKTVLVLGGSMSGMGVAHRLLKYTLPHEKDLKVIVVSKVRLITLTSILMCLFPLTMGE